MAIGIAIVLGLVALAYVLLPIWERGPQSGLSAAAVEPGRSLNEPEQAARMALQDVEFDYQLGNIAETEYRSLRERYMHTALVAMKERHEQDQELDEEIEERLRKIKENHEQKQQ